MVVRRWLGDTLLHAGLVTRQQLDEALAVQGGTGEELGDALVSLGYLSHANLQRTLCADAGIPFLAGDEIRSEPTALALVPPALAREHAALPLRLESRHLVAVMADPFDVAAIRSLTRAAGRTVRVVGAERDAIERAISEAYAGSTEGALAQAGGASVAIVMTPAPFLELARNDGDAARSAGRPGRTTPARLNAEEQGVAAAMVDDVLRRGVDSGATDIHVEPEDNGVRVRYRIDGVLTDGPVFPKSAQAALISRIKILSSLDIADSRVPQDGRTRVKVAGRNVDLRVSAFPTLHGEDLVLRILDRGRVALQLDRLGIETDDLLLLRIALQRSHGLIPVTGPTSSGRTTTLYAALLELSTGDRAIFTLEDPIEYEIPQIRQAQVNARAGLTFANGLRSLLRHDPDVLFVGEMRDQETVQIALSAALTGHLVMTTLHTTTAAGTIPRLLDMGAEPFVVASAVSMFVSQRLVRTLCSDCKTKVEMPLAVRRRFGLEDVTLYGPVGCPRCRGTGFRGRIGIFELLPMSPDIVTAIHERQSPEQIQRDAGRPTLLQDGIRKVRAGVTTLDEILRVTA